MHSVNLHFDTTPEKSHRILKELFLQLKKLEADNEIKIEVIVDIPLDNSSQLDVKSFNTLFCTHLNISLKELRSLSRRRDLVNKRFLYIHLRRRLFNDTLSTIGNDINRDHTSVIHGLRTAERHLKAGDTTFVQLYTCLQRELTH